MENQGLSLFDLIIKGGIIMVPIAVLSILSIYFMIERAVYITKAFQLENNFMNNIKLFSN
jgi:biopolymer transport protein ExbB